MGPVHFNCYKISLKLPLDRLDAHFNLHKPMNWKEYASLDPKHVSEILQNGDRAKKVYLFKSGCVCFVDFNESEIYVFLQYIASIVGSVDFSLFTKYNENHISNNEYNIESICIILAKSVELSKLEADLEDSFDRSERLIDFLQSGKLHINRKLILSAARNLRLEYAYAGSIGTGGVSDSLSQYYELDVRQKVVQSKMEDIRNIFSTYSSFSYNQRKSRTLWFEIALLSLFPASYVLEIIQKVFDFLLHLH